MATAMARRRAKSREEEDEADFNPKPMAYILDKGSSPEDPCPTVVPMTDADMRKQLKKVKDSDGFESDAYLINENGSHLGPYCLLPASLNRRMDRMKHHCEIAISHYNSKQGTDLEVERVVKANTHTVYALEYMGDEYYFTFTAVAKESGKTSLYQAKVLEPFSYPSDPITVFLCRRRPKRPSSS